MPLALLLLGAAALPSVAHAGTLAVHSVSAARSATAGLPVAVEVGRGAERSDNGRKDARLPLA